MGGIAAALFLFFLVVVPMLSVFSIEPTGAGTAALQAAVALVGVLIAIILGLSILYGYLAYEKFRYWITNHRTVGRRGVVGFSVDSMPLENIADVIINRGILDRILGLSSVYVQPIGGAFSLPMPGPAAFGRLMGSNMFVGLGPADAVEIQQLVFHLRDLRKRETGRIL